MLVALDRATERDSRGAPRTGSDIVRVTDPSHGRTRTPVAESYAMRPVGRSPGAVARRLSLRLGARAGRRLNEVPNVLHRAEAEIDVLPVYVQLVAASF